MGFRPPVRRCLLGRSVSGSPCSLFRWWAWGCSDFRNHLDCKHTGSWGHVMGFLAPRPHTATVLLATMRGGCTEMRQQFSGPSIDTEVAVEPSQRARPGTLMSACADGGASASRTSEHVHPVRQRTSSDAFYRGSPESTSRHTHTPGHTQKVERGFDTPNPPTHPPTPRGRISATIGSGLHNTQDPALGLPPTGGIPCPLTSDPGLPLHGHENTRCTRYYGLTGSTVHPCGRDIALLSDS